MSNTTRRNFLLATAAGLAAAIPALMAYRELFAETKADRVVVPEASLRAGLLLDLAGASEGRGFEDLRVQVLASAAALGDKYRYDAAHARNVANLAVRLFDELRAEHGLQARDRLLLEVAALLHDIGIFVALNGHHKHSLYLLQSSEIFGLSHDDMAVVANVARYHRRSMPEKSHQSFMALDRERRVDVVKLAALLRVANALDADHLQKVLDLRLLRNPPVNVLRLLEGRIAVGVVALHHRHDLVQVKLPALRSLAIAGSQDRNRLPLTVA